MRKMKFNPILFKLLETLKFICRNTIKKYHSTFSKTVSKYRFSKLSKLSNIKLNLGSGPIHGTDGWINIDIYGSDINWNLLNPIPLPENSVQVIYSSHLLEHLEFNARKNLLTDCLYQMGNFMCASQMRDST